MMIALLILCSLLALAVGVALLATASSVEEHEPTPAELSTSRPVVLPWSLRVRAHAGRVLRWVVHGRVRPRRLRVRITVTGADVTAAHRIFGGRVADLWSISESHKPLPCR